MVEILPAILEKTFGAVQDKVARLQGIASAAQLDIIDGDFIPGPTWKEHEQLSALGGDIKFDVHLMVEKPEQWVKRWEAPNVFRLTFHQEATYDVRRTAVLIKSLGKEAGVALKIETPVSAIYDILEEIDLVLLMAVAPGGQGRAFDGRVVDKVKELRAHNANIKIGVDGGVTPLVASSLVAAGANVLVSGSYLFSQTDIKSAIASLQV
ncbi:MAG: ribulose-phosphate 3-epimerase [Patescibacteria group bacterium]